MSGYPMASHDHDEPTRDELRAYEEWEECDACGGRGMDGHDCGEDTCQCLDPEENVPCDTCRGDGGWYVYR